MPDSSELNTILSSLRQVKQSRKDQWTACCPAHHDKNPSLSVGIGENSKVLFRCHAGCDYKDIMRALNLPLSRNGGAFFNKKKEVAVYNYTDEEGCLQFQKVRYEPKTFLIRRPNGEGGFIWGLGEVKPVLYNLVSLANEDRSSELIFVVEGEKDADRLIDFGLIATCNFDGAGVSDQRQKWRSEHYDSFFISRKVIILADNDTPGRAHAEQIANSLFGKADSVKIIELPELAEHGDVSDWLDMGNSVDQLMKICETGSTWEPAQQKLDWEIRSLKDAFGDRPPCEYLVDGLIETPSINIFFGSPGTLKSMALSDMCVDIASGSPWLPMPNRSDDGFGTMLSPTLYIDLDNGARRMDERMGALARERDLSFDTPVHYVSMPSPSLDGSNQGSLLTLENHIRELGIRFVVIDNLGLVTGQVDENSSEMAQIMGGFRNLAESLNIAIIFIHHQRKSNTSSNRLGDSLRGHSSIEAAADLALRMEREPNSNIVTLRPTKVRGAEIPIIKAEFMYEHVLGAKELDSARFWRVEVMDTSSPSAITDAVRSALEELEPQNQGDLVATVKSKGITVSEHRIRSHFELLVDQGYLSMQRGVSNAKLFRLSS